MMIAGAHPRILVVEDEGIVAKDLKRRLERLGYTVTGIADSGEGALELIRDTQPQLVLMDIILQGPMDGIQVAERVRQQHDIPVVFLTSHSDTATIQRAKLTTPYGYLVKPFEERELRTTIEIALYRHAAEARQRLYQRAIDTAAVGMMVTAAVPVDFLIAEVNPAFERMSGYPAEEMIGWNGWMDELTQPADAATIRQALTERRAFSLTTQIRRKDASSFWSEVSLSPVCDNAGKVTHFIWFLNDISERRRAEEARARLEAQLHQAQKMEAIGTLAGGIAHDFNNILGAIIGYSQLIRSDLPDGTLPKDNIGKVIKAAHRARDLVRQILAFSRQTVPERKPVRLATIINETLELLRAGLPATIEIRRDLRTANDSVLADPSQLHQVLMNLCTNAGHAMGERGGTLTVTLDSVETGAAPNGTLLSLPSRACLCLSVSDTGCGIPPENLARIFEPFFTTKPVGEGTGLGLSVVHGIIKNHGGEITATSQPGTGTTFHIFLPQALDASTSAHETTILRASGGSEHILFVDDEEALVDIATQRLAGLGYCVTAFTDSQRALEAIRASPSAFDALVTDQSMPRLTGLALACEARRLRPDLPILICTGHSEADLGSEFRALGRCDTVMKPMDPDTMSAALRRALDAIERRPGFSSALQP